MGRILIAAALGFLAVMLVVVAMHGSAAQTWAAVTS